VLILFYLFIYLYFFWGIFFHVFDKRNWFKKIKIGSVYWTTNFATFLEKFNNFLDIRKLNFKNPSLVIALFIGVF